MSTPFGARLAGDDPAIPRSRLEAVLWKARTVVEAKEWEVDTLRSILRGETGTAAQRAQLVRLVSQYKPRKSAHSWINQNISPLGTTERPFTMASYSTERTASQNQEGEV